MLSANPFAAVGASLPAGFLQWFLIVMVLAVVVGTLFDVVHAPRPMSEEELREGFRDLVRRLYAADFTNWRRGKARRMRHAEL